jgi:hypothetical protein
VAGGNRLLTAFAAMHDGTFDLAGSVTCVTGQGLAVLAGCITGCIMHPAPDVVAARNARQSIDACTRHCHVI